jgi:hypothetical protein
MKPSNAEKSVEPNPMPPPPRRRRWLTALLMLVTFICGGIVGGGAVAKFIETRVQEAIHHPERMPHRVAARLARRLDLSETQHAEVLKILQRRQQELFAVRAKFQPQVEAILDSIEGDVSHVLDAEQQKQWQQDAQRFRERFTPPMPKTGEPEA